MPTTVSRDELQWRVHGPWGERTFLVLPSSPLPHAVLARELGILGSIGEDAVEAILRDRSWDAAQRLWVADSGSGEETVPL